MSDIETKALFTMRMKVETQPLGPTHGTERRVVILTECIIDGDRVKGRVLPGGSDWLGTVNLGAVWLVEVGQVALAGPDDNARPA
jgi:hypothetical protein